MKIPWRNLGSEPAIATIEGLYLIVSPKPRSDTTAKEEENRAQSAKQRRLKLAELLGSDRKHDKDSEEAGDKGKKKKKKKKSGFIKKMRMKVVNNVQIFVNNVHIRFEDNISNPRQPYAAGLTIDHFHAQSTDGDWKPTFLKLGEELAHKLITLKDLAIYWDHAADKSQVHLKYKDHAQMAEIMDQLAADAALNTAAAVATVTQPHLQSNKGGPPLTPAVPAMLSKPAPSAKGHHYIIRPISGVLKATMWNGAALRLDQPKMKLDVELETVELGLNRVQFSSLLDILDYFSQYNANSRYMKYRPKGGVTPQENPRGWWQYAINSVRATIREKNEQWSWEHMMQWKRHRQRYIELYRDKKSGKRKLKSAEAQELSDLEHAHSYKDLLTWRRLANAAIDIKKMKKKEDKEREKQERKEKQQKFFSKLLLKSDKKKSKSKDKDKVKDKDKERDKDKDKDKSRWMSSKKKDKKSKSSKSDSLEESAGGMDDDSLDESSIADSETSSVMSAGMSDDGSASGDNLGSDAVGSAADQQAAEALKELYRAIDYNDTDGDDKQKEYPPEVCGDWAR
jgi:vacuolar protein sorting-associated protein 13A/C